MMTAPMDNITTPSRELVQRLYKKNIELENKRHKSAQARVPSDPNAWQQMRENYEAIILEDHVFSEKHEIEYALWQLHYRRIEELRAHFSAAFASAGSATTGGKGPPRPDRIKKIRSLFKTFLSEATGFYHDLILKIRAKYGLPLGHFSEEPQNLNTIEKDGKKHSDFKKGLLSCHRSLIYLGDLARYKGLYGEGDSKTRDYAAASSYYMQAVSLWPSNGNPHHQLAILASYSGDDLGATYRYFRSLAVDSPFTTARDNLIVAFEKNRQNYSQLSVGTKASAIKTVSSRNTGKGRVKGETAHPTEDIKVEATAGKEKTPTLQEIYNAFCIRFVRLNGILFTRTSLETFGEVFSSVSRDLNELLSSGPEEKMTFGTDSVENGLFIVRLVAILIFTVHNVNREIEGQTYAEILQRSVLLRNAFSATFEIMGHILKRSSQLHDPSSSYLLPGVLVFVEWLACHPDTAIGNDVEEKQATARSFFWNHYILFLNKLVSDNVVSVVEEGEEACFHNMIQYDEEETDNRLALWEDYELRGFLPLLPAQLILDFSRNHSTGSDGSGKEKRVRFQRIFAAGKALADVVQIDGTGIYFDQKLKKFITAAEPQQADHFMVSTSETTEANGMLQENPAEMRNAEPAPPKATMYMEAEEEDEEIVFKPTNSEKFGDIPAPKLTTYEPLRPAPRFTTYEAPENTTKDEPLGPAPRFTTYESPENTTKDEAPKNAKDEVPKNAKDEWTSYSESISAPVSSFNLQNAFDANNQPPLASFGMPTHNQQPIFSGAINWLVNQQTHLVSGVNNLSIGGGGFPGNAFLTNFELNDGFGDSRPHAHSLPFPRSVDLSTDFVFPDQIVPPEAVIPSKFDSIMSLGSNCDNMSLDSSSALQTSSRKKPVSRPVRYHGPPPGFSTVPPKQLEDVKVESDLKDRIIPVDDYSWLDGYQLSLPSKAMTPNDCMNHTTIVSSHVNNDNGSMISTINFPFPGKQIPSMLIQNASQKSWMDYQRLEQLKEYQEQQQLQQSNQQSALLKERQYQGQSLWSDRFFV